MCLFSFFLAAMLSVCSFFPSQADANKLPSYMISPSPVVPEPVISDPLYVRKSILRNKTFFTDYYLRNAIQYLPDYEKEQKDRFYKYLTDFNSVVRKYLQSPQQEEDIADFEKHLKKSCWDCIENRVTGNYPSIQGYSEACPDILKSKRFLTHDDKNITFKSGSYLYTIQVDYQGSIHEQHFSIKRQHQDIPDAQSVPLHSFPHRGTTSAAFFEHNGKLYYIPNTRRKELKIFELDTNAGIFKESCQFTYGKTGLNYENTPVCQAVAEHKYTVNPEEQLQTLLSPEELKKLQEDGCDIAKKEDKTIASSTCSEIMDINGGTFLKTNGIFSVNEGIKTDYNNDGKKDILIRAFVDHTNTYGFMLYNRDKKLLDGFEAFPSSFEEKMNFITINGKNYLLTSNEDAPVRLDEITTLPDGTNKTERLCSFKTQYKWR